MKRAMLRLLTTPLVRGVFRHWTVNSVPIVMLHRFSEQTHVGRVTRASLEQMLRVVREVGLQPLTLGDLGCELSLGNLPPRAVCFTVDDGYADFEQIAHPVFREWDVPVTVFVTSGFVDGGMWNWWDRIRYTFDHTQRVGAPLNDAQQRPLGPWFDRRSATEQVVASCKEVADELKQSTIERIEEQLDVEVPARPTAEFAALDWDSVTRLAAQGVEFGGHTVTHPILSRVDGARLRSEIEDSLAAVHRATGREVSCFAYPNGRNRDFDARAYELLREFGVRTAVTTEYGIPNRATLARPDALLRLPRVTLGEDRAGRLALFAGVEAAKTALGRK